MPLPALTSAPKLRVKTTKSSGLIRVIECPILPTPSREIAQGVRSDGSLPEESRNSSDPDSDAASQSPISRRHWPTRADGLNDSIDETQTCVTIIGNYVRADEETAASFFRDILPKVMCWVYRTYSTPVLAGESCLYIE